MENQNDLRYINIRKCIVKGCSNQSDQGVMIGDLCSPCHGYIVEGEVGHSQAYRNAIELAREFLQGKIDSMQVRLNALKEAHGVLAEMRHPSKFSG